MPGSEESGADDFDNEGWLSVPSGLARGGPLRLRFCSELVSDVGDSFRFPGRPSSGRRYGDREWERECDLLHQAQAPVITCTSIMQTLCI